MRYHTAPNSFTIATRKKFFELIDYASQSVDRRERRSVLQRTRTVLATAILLHSAPFVSRSDSHLIFPIVAINGHHAPRAPSTVPGPTHPRLSRLHGQSRPPQVGTHPTAPTPPKPSQEKADPSATGTPPKNETKTTLKLLMITQPAVVGSTARRGQRTRSSHNNATRTTYLASRSCSTSLPAAA